MNKSTCRTHPHCIVTHCFDVFQRCSCFILLRKTLFRGAWSCNVTCKATVCEVNQACLHKVKFPNTHLLSDLTTFCLFVWIRYSNAQKTFLILSPLNRPSAFLLSPLLLFFIPFSFFLFLPLSLSLQSPSPPLCFVPCCSWDYVLRLPVMLGLLTFHSLAYGVFTQGIE